MLRIWTIIVLFLSLGVGMGPAVARTAPTLQAESSSVSYLPLVMFNTFAPRIAFASNRNGNFEIYILDPRTQNLRQFTQDGAQDLVPGWGPNGRLAWASNRDGNWDIYVSDAFGHTPPTRITFHSGIDFDPTWSPDGRRIAFSSDRSGNMDIWTMNAKDGTLLVRLTTEPTQQRQPVWSPDGRRIAYISDQEGRDKLFVMNADGSNQRKVVEILPTELFPAWSPDGQWIIFSTMVDNKYELYAVNVDRGTLQQATNTAILDARFVGQPSWSPDGKQVVFRAVQGGNTDLFIMDFDATAVGRNFRRIASHPALDVDPVWSR